MESPRAPSSTCFVSAGPAGADADGAALAVSADRFRWHANQALKVDEHGLALIAPKLDLRARAVASLPGPERVVEARAIAAEIGWIETSLPAAAAGAILAIEDLLSAKHAEDSVEICHQLRVFEAFEHGLLATWETPEEVVYVLG